MAHRLLSYLPLPLSWRTMFNKVSTQKACSAKTDQGLLPYQMFSKFCSHRFLLLFDFRLQMCICWQESPGSLCLWEAHRQYAIP